MENFNATWDLEAIYPDEQVWYSDLETVKGIADKLASMQGKLCEGPENLLEALGLYVKCDEYFSKLFTYAHCHFDAQMSDAGWKKLYETVFGESSL